MNTMRQQNDDVPLVLPVSKELLSGDTSSEVVRDRGHRAWLQTLGSFMIFFSSVGIANSFGVYLSYYLTENTFNVSTSTVSWIGSLQSALCLAIGIVAGPLYDRGFFRTLVYAGSFLVVLGQMMLSLSTSYYQVFLSQGICMGLGAGMTLVPAFCILITYFDRHLEMATGIASMGGSIGGILFPIIFSRTIDKIGFPWATRVIGLVLLVPLLIAAAVFRPVKKPPRPQALNHFIDWKMFKEPAFVSYLLGIFLLVLGLCIPIVYLESYASVIRIKNQALVSYILPIYLAANTCGCFGINVFAKWLGPINLMVISTSLSGVMVFILLKVTTESGLIFMVFILGFLAAAPVSLQPALLVKISPDPRVIGSRIGCGYLASTLGNLVGPPIAGAILDRYGYDATWIFSACMYLTAASLFLICRGFLTRWKLFVAT